MRFTPMKFHFFIPGLSDDKMRAFVGVVALGDATAGAEVVMTAGGAIRAVDLLGPLPPARK